MPPTSFGYAARLRNVWPVSTRSGEKQPNTFAPLLAATFATNARVVPIGTVVSRITSRSSCAPAISVSVAPTSALSAMLPSSRTSTGTTTKATSASRTAAGPSMVARSRPEPTCSARSSGSFGSPPHGATPELMMATRDWLMSTACTRQPWEANCRASGRPIFPEPITAMVPTVPGAPTHGFAVTGVPWVHGWGSAVKEPPSMEVARPSGSVVRAPITPPLFRWRRCYTAAIASRFGRTGTPPPRADASTASARITARAPS